MEDFIFPPTDRPIAEMVQDAYALAQRNSPTTIALREQLLQQQSEALRSRPSLGSGLVKDLRASAGPITAIVAGVVLVGGAVYALTRPSKNSEPANWRERVQASRIDPANGLNR
ncbi:MAG: hypothetical protein WDM86_08780 [Rhizomicrobium sp.]